MKLLPTFLVVFIILLLSTVHFAQESNAIKAYQNGDYYAAARLIEKEIDSGGGNARLYNYLGLAYVKLIEYENAKKAFKNAIKLDRDDPSLYSNLASVLLKLSKDKDALKQANTGLALDPSHLQSLLMRSLALSVRGKIDDALADANRAIQLYPDSIDAYLVKKRVHRDVMLRDWGEGENRRLELLETLSGILEECLEHCSGNKSAIEIELNDVESFIEVFKREVNRSNLSEAKSGIPMGCQPFIIQRRGLPGYTDIARHKNTEGNVRLAVMFRADGTVGPVLTLQGLDNGLTEKAIEAARRFTFEPQMCDGKPEDVVKTVWFGFKII